MLCPHCGNKNEDSAKFCKNCGKLLLVAKKNETNTVAQTDFIWGYRFHEAPNFDIVAIQNSLNTKNDYKLIEHELVKNDIYVYKKGDGPKAGILILAKVKGEIFILANEKGLMSIRSRYINVSFDNPKKEKIDHKEMGKVLEDAVKKLGIPTGTEAETEKGVGGWLAYFIIGTAIFALISFFTSFSNFTSWNLIDMGIAVYALYTCYLLAKIKPGALRNIKIVLIIYTAVNLLLIFVDPSSATTSEGINNPVRNLIVNLIWLAYFYKSKRVKATYLS